MTVATQPGEAITIPLPDGDQLINAAEVCRRLGIAPGTLEAHLHRTRSGKNRDHPFPLPEDDPVALIVSAPGEAEGVRKLLLARGGRRPVPMFWRASAIEARKTSASGPKP